MGERALVADGSSRNQLPASRGDSEWPLTACPHHQMAEVATSSSWWSGGPSRWLCGPTGVPVRLADPSNEGRASGVRLKAFSVTNYKSILDSGRVELDPNVTCLMGKNESGKSALLQALWKFKNAANAKFDLLWDLPAERYTALRSQDPEVVTLEFSLESADNVAFVARFGSHLPAPATFTLRSTYGGKNAVEPPFAPPPAITYETVEPFVSAIKAAIADRSASGPEAAEQARLQAATQTLTALASAGAPATLATSVPTATIDAAIKALHGLRGEDLGGADLPGTTAALEAFSRESAALRVREEAERWLVNQLPIFIYFDDYGRLRTRINLSEFVSLQGNQPTDREKRTLHRTQLALFEWASLDPQELLTLGQPKKGNEQQEAVERRKAERDRLLESASFKLSGDWLDWWDQRTHELVISADGEDLELRVRDNLNPWRIPFGERSRGFQWFFSFYLTFLVESEKEHRGAIILLDEPGLHLHMTAQLKLLAFFQKIAKKNQLVYSSHSPFMVDPDHTDNVRTVYLDLLEKSNPKSPAYTRCSETSEPEGDRETLLPLQAAGAYHLAQTIFLGKRTLIVEGITDYWLLRTLSRTSCEASDPFLHDDTVIVWAGGTAHLLPLASVMASREQMGPNRMAVLLDSDKAGRNKAKELVGMLLPGESSVLMLGDLLGMQSAEAEDLVEVAELHAALKHLGRTESPSPRQPDESNVPYLRRLYQENEWGELTPTEKARIVHALLEVWGAEGAAPHENTLRRAQKVFLAVNERFVKLGAM